MSRNHVFVGVGCVLLALGVAQLVGCGGGCAMHGAKWVSITSGTSVNGVELPHEATLRYSSTERPSRFALKLDSASIVVEGDAALTGVEAEFVVREKTPGDASLGPAADSIAVVSAGGNPVLVVSAKVRVPAATSVDVTTSFGSVTVRGVHGAASVAAATDSGRVELKDLADVPAVSGRSSFGDVSLTTGAGLGEVTLVTDSGSASASDVGAATKVTLKSSFGSVKAEAVNASESMTLRTDSGSVTVEDVHAGHAKLRSSFGSVTAKRSVFDHVDAHTDSGSVRLTGCTYKTKDLGTDFGKVTEEE